MNKVAILGHFALGVDKANGQTIKTKIVGAALKQEIGNEKVDYFDTMGGWKFLFKMPFVMLKMLKSHQHIIIMAENAYADHQQDDQDKHRNKG